MLREIPSTNRRAFAFLLSICVLHLGIRLYLINQQGFFYEETVTWSYSRSPESLILAMVSDVHPPLYFALMSVWTKLFGTSEIAFRLPSVLGSFLTMITLMVFARELDQRRNLVLPILVGALYVCLPYDIHLSMTARSWTMAVFLCGLFSYLYMCVTLRDKKNWFVGSLIVAICAVFVHYITLLSVAAAVTAATLIQPTKANLRYAGKTLGIIFTFLLPYLLLVFPFQLIAKANIPFHFYFFWEQNAVSCLLEPINPGTWNPFFLIEESAGVFHGTGLFVALVGVALVLIRAGVCWANRLTRFMMLQVGIMIIFLLLSPTPLCNQRTMCIFLPPFLLLLSFTLEDLFTSKQLVAVLVSGVFVTSFVAMSLSGFPYPSEAGSLREIAEFLRPSWNNARHPAALLSPSTHLLTLQYLQSRGSTVFTKVFFAPDPVVLLDSPWYEPLHPEMMELPPKEVPRWNRGPQYEHGFVWTMNRLFAMNRGVTDVFYLREGTHNLFEWTNQGHVKLSQFEDEAQFVMTRMKRFGIWTVYHLQPRCRMPVSGTQHNEAQASSYRVDDEQTGGSAEGM